MPVAKIAGLAGVCHTLGQEAMRFIAPVPGALLSAAGQGVQTSRTTSRL